MVNTGTRVAPVNIAFFSSRNAALIERKMLQYTTLSIQLHNCTFSEIKTQIFTLSDVLACVSIHCAYQKQHSNRDFLTESVNNTLRTPVVIENEYLLAYNLGAGVKTHLFVVCINVNMQDIQCFCLHLFSLTFSKIKSIFLLKIRSKQCPQAKQRVIDSLCGFAF